MDITLATENDPPSSVASGSNSGTPKSQSIASPSDQASKKEPAKKESKRTVKKGLKKARKTAAKENSNIYRRHRENMDDSIFATKEEFDEWLNAKRNDRRNFTPVQDAWIWKNVDASDVAKNVCWQTCSQEYWKKFCERRSADQLNIRWYYIKRKRDTAIKEGTFTEVPIPEGVIIETATSARDAEKTKRSMSAEQAARIDNARGQQFRPNDVEENLRYLVSYMARTSGNPSSLSAPAGFNGTVPVSTSLDQHRGQDSDSLPSFCINSGIPVLTPSAGNTEECLENEESMVPRDDQYQVELTNMPGSEENPIEVYLAAGARAAFSLGRYSAMSISSDADGFLEPRTQYQQEFEKVEKALITIPVQHSAIIFTDSQYVVGCFTEWRAHWTYNGFVDARGNPIPDHEIIQRILNLVDLRARYNAKTDFKYVRGANGN